MGWVCSYVEDDKKCVQNQPAGKNFLEMFTWKTKKKKKEEEH
jgi:hypothetical protein